MFNKLDELKKEAIASFAGVRSEEELYALKVRYLGKKGLLTDILKDLGNVGAEVRPVIGARANELKGELEETYERQSRELKNRKIQAELEAENVDVTLPGTPVSWGRAHPINRVLSEMKAIFREMGFTICEGPEIETDFYNFEALNIPKDHPARDMQDTFYLGGPIGGNVGAYCNTPLLLRTHTSPVQIRVMQKQKPPIQMVSPGVVYRRDADVTHSPMFHQIEGLMVDRHITMAHLKGVLEVFLRKIFDPDIKLKFRPSFFPFTEPSAEVDIECMFCEREGGICRVCKGSGWLEIMGCGMVDPAVFKFVNIDPKIYTGFAFGIGVERVAMLKYGINDIRLFYENDLRFLEQF
ncbi:MAG: phenylalanine--tRNA ligase subunit alpha [Deltaproteobacteria bacterium]|nr:phenylalanine--tRNA ligase subunit alpha [Deltaproteobacteria bacterium]